MSSSGTSSLFVPHPELTKLTPGDIPNSAYVRVISRELYANAGSIPTTLGGGQHGHIGMLMPVAEYAALAGAAAPPFAMPNRPAVPAYGGMTSAVQNETRANFDRELRDYETAVATKSLLKNQILEAVPKEYHKWTAPIYGAPQQYAEPEDDSPPLSAAGLKRLQEVVGTLLFYCRAIDLTSSS